MLLFQSKCKIILNMKILQWLKEYTHFIMNPTCCCHIERTETGNDYNRLLRKKLKNNFDDSYSSIAMIKMSYYNCLMVEELWCRGINFCEWS